MKPIISIIVPCYNSAQYLNQCVESIVNQTCSNWELILVDDGSNDQTPRMCDDYARRDNRIKVVHKANGGLVSARNAGYNAVTGEWMTYLDSDDWVSSDMIEILTKAIEDHEDLDLIFWCMVQVLGDKVIKNKWDWKQYSDGKVYDKNECRKISSYVMNYNSGISDAVCKLLRTNWCHQYDVSHNASLKQGEESVDFVMRSFYYAEKALFLKKNFYFYRYNPISISKKVDEKNALCIVDCMNVMARFIDSVPENTGFLKEFQLRNAYVLISIAMHTYFNPEFKYPFKERIDKFEELILRNCLFYEAVANVDCKEFDKFRMVALWCIQHKKYYLLDIIAKIKYMALKIGVFEY